MNSTLILVLSPPRSRLAYHALRLAQSLKNQQKPFQVFFYQDATTVADNQLWYADDELNITQQWQNLAIDLPVCVSAAIQRGVMDQENIQRHQKLSDLERAESPWHTNLAKGFSLVGLGQLAMAINESKHVIQF
ncbi:MULTISPECIES: sulfurtransferase complex subunit TusD [unclassified Acinetobacter]|uniref:sulfurtransferase complex subunit TusD n=1 Tax=unclassified Acinetobacter TaxID=196816 RepID=UPI0035B8CCE4